MIAFTLTRWIGYAIIFALNLIALLSFLIVRLVKLAWLKWRMKI